MSLIANHAAVNARVIGANEHESHYILDLLMNNSSEIIPDMLSTDTHGVNHRPWLENSRATKVITRYSER